MCIATKEMTGTSGLENYCEIWEPALPLADKIQKAANENAPQTNRIAELEAAFGIEKLKAALEEIGF